MNNETISSRQATSIIITFLFGSSVVLGVSSSAGQDTWIALLCSLIITIPMVMIYARIMKLFPQKDIYVIIEELFGKIFGKLIIVFITWYAIHLASMVLANFSEFIHVTSMPETPQLPVMALMIFMVIYGAKSGVKTFGKWVLIVLPILVFVVLLTSVLSIKNIDSCRFFPIMSHSPMEIASGSFSIFTFPFGETVLFLALAGSIQKGKSPYKIYLYGVLIGAIILFIVIIRNLLTLGVAMVEAEYFPSYVAARIIEVGDFLTRIEGSISMNFILAGIVKLAVCVFAASMGISKLFNIQDYKKMLFPTGLLILALCAILFENIMQMFSFLSVSPIYVIPFQIIIPVIIWIAAEIKNRKKSPKPEKTSS